MKERLKKIVRKLIPFTYKPLFLWPYLYVKNLQKKYTVVTIENLKERKSSSTLFILGTGSALNTVSEEEWEIVRQHDSLGFNYFLFHPFVPTYFHTEYNRDYIIRNKQATLFQRRRNDYSKTIFILSSKALKFGMHPRLTPEWFPDGVTISFFKYPALVRCPLERGFQADDFRGRFMYRGSLNLMLYIAYLLKYKEIILLGCEMNNGVAFYEEMPDAQWAVKTIKHAPLEERKRQLYGGVYATKGKHGFDTTVYAFNDFVLRPAGVKLFVARKESVLYPRIPYKSMQEVKK